MISSPDTANSHVALFQNSQKPRAVSSRYRKAHRPMSNMTSLYSKGLREMQNNQRLGDVRNLSINAVSLQSKI